MPRKAFESLSEPMFYVLMALRRQQLCGVDIVAWIEQKTDGRIILGPGTLYTILPKLTEEDIIREVSTEGRRRNYAITPRGLQMYNAECQRLRQCLADLTAEEQEDAP